MLIPEPFLQLIAAIILGALIGVERDIAGKRAGMRTHALVALGSALFVIISTQLSAAIVGASGFDPIRIAASIITGVGFIGAGIIIFHEERETLHGLTTAAGLWVAAAVGMAIGFTFYGIAGFTVVLTLFIFRIMWYIETAIERRYGTSATRETDR